MRSTLLIVIIAAVSTSARAEAGQQNQPLDPLYDRIAADLRAGKPLVIAAYYGLWFTHNRDPDRNLNWGTYYGNARMLRRAAKDKHVRRLYTHYRWRLVHEAAGVEDPLRTLVFHHRVRPNARWRRAGVTAPFDAYLVMQAFASREEAAIRMARTLRQSVDRPIELDGGVRIDVGAAQAAGYVGHNLFYDYPGFEWDGLDKVRGAPDAAKGVFAVGCKTGRVPGFDALVGPNVFALLYSKTLMAAEGYSTLALADGLLRHLTGRGMARLGNKTYAYFQRLGKPDRRVGKPFVSHGPRLFGGGAAAP